MSDLQCPATFLLVPSDAEPAELGRALAHDRVAEVRSAPHPQAVALARRLATSWGLPEPGGADLDETTCRAVLTDLADLRRGETSVVVVERGLLGAVAGRESGDGPALVEVRVDADGWVVQGRSAWMVGRGVRDATDG